MHLMVLQTTTRSVSDVEPRAEWCRVAWLDALRVASRLGTCNYMRREDMTREGRRLQIVRGRARMHSSYPTNQVSSERLPALE